MSLYHFVQINVMYKYTPIILFPQKASWGYKLMGNKPAPSAVKLGFTVLLLQILKKSHLLTNILTSSNYYLQT